MSIATKNKNSTFASDDDVGEPQTSLVSMLLSPATLASTTSLVHPPLPSTFQTQEVVTILLSSLDKS